MDARSPFLKKIKIEDLKVGMLIVNLDRSWFKHPFLTSKKTITSEKQIQKLREYGIREVYIDPEKGREVLLPQTLQEVLAPSAPAVGETEQGTKIGPGPAPQEELESPSHLPDQRDSIAYWEKIVPNVEEKFFSRQTAIGITPEDKVPFSGEIEAARQVQRQAQVVVKDIMQDIRLGKNIESGPVKNVVHRMIDSIFNNRTALASLTRIKDYDEYTFVHSINVCILSLTMGRHLNFSREELEQIGIGALLHDAGKMKISPHILNKPGKLTEEEFHEIKKHPLYSLELLERAEGIPGVSRQVALQHHERYNGRGYPYGLKGNEIGRFGQIAAIIDVYDAITSDRAYKKAIPPHKAMRELYQGGKEDFNQLLVEFFIQCVGIYPVGTLVLLDSEEIGIVYAVNPEILLRPNVLVLYRDSKTFYPKAFLVDLTEKKPNSEWFKRTIVMPLDSQRWNIRMDDYLPNLKIG